MNIRRSFPLAAALSVPLLLALHPRGDELSFSPEDGSTLSKELELDMTFNLEDISMTVNGQEMPSR